MGLTQITGCGFYVPEKVLTNYDLEQQIDTSDEWIYTRTGIKARRIAADCQATSDLAAVAARRALESAGLPASELDLIIVATATPDLQFPATACLVQQAIGAQNAAAFDMAAACSGFVYGLSMADAYIKSHIYQNILLIGAETFSRIIDWQDRNTCILFGDGAGAVVLQKSSNGSGILSSFLRADGSKSEFIQIPAGGSRIPASRESVASRLHYLKMNGREVYKVAPKGMAESIVTSLGRIGAAPEDIDWLIPHQANVRIIQSLAQILNLPLEKVVINLDRYGNTSAASIPIALSEANQEGKIKKGDLVVLVSFGAGLTWGTNIIRW